MPDNPDTFRKDFKKIFGKVRTRAREVYEAEYPASLEAPLLLKLLSPLGRLLAQLLNQTRRFRPLLGLLNRIHLLLEEDWTKIQFPNCSKLVRTTKKLGFFLALKEERGVRDGPLKSCNQ